MPSPVFMYEHRAGYWFATLRRERCYARRRAADMARTRMRPRVDGLEDRCLLSMLEFPVPTSNAGPGAITAGPDGNLWFTESNVGQIGTIDPTTDAIAEYTAPISTGGGITTGPDGNVWLGGSGTTINTNGPAMINPTTHAITSLSYDGWVGGFATGPDGNLWFTDYENIRVNMINMATHVITEIPLPDALSGPTGGITAGPDGNLWVCDASANNTIDEINPTTYVITKFAIPTPNSGPDFITVGRDGNLWFTESTGSQIGMMNPTTHAITEFAVPTTGSFPSGITAGPDGNLWFTGHGADLPNGQLGPGQIGEINPTTHAITEFAVPYANSHPGVITAGPDGNLWFNDSGNNSIGEVTLNSDHFVVTQQPPANVTAGAPFGLTVEAEDSSGNLVASFNDAVTLALASAPAGATLGGTLSVTASNGVATFSGLTLTKAASGYTLQVSSSGITSASTNPISVTPAAASQIVISQQPPVSITAGSSFVLRATVEDPYGNVETADNGAVTVSLASGPDGAVLGGTLAVATSQGVATFAGLTLTTAASGYTLQVSRGGLSGATTNAINVTPAAPAKLVPATAPGSVTAGVAVGLTVDVEDPYGNLSAPGGSLSISIASGPTGATLGGQTTATASGGVAAFSGLTLTRAGSYTLQASGGGLPPATIGPIVVMPAAPARLLVTTPAPSTVTAGIGFGLSVSAEDAYGNPTPSFGGDVTMTAAGSSGSGPLGGTTTVSPNGGLAVFSGLILDSVGTYSLQVSSVSLGAIAAGTIAVSPAQASQLVLLSQPPAAITAGTAFGFRVEAEDAYGNPATGFNGLLTAALTLNAGNAVLAGPATATATQGVVAFAGLSVDRAGNGDTIQVTGNGLPGVTTGTFDVTPAATAQLVIAAQPPATVNAGAPFGFSVAAVDPFGNAVTSFSGPVTIALGKHPGQGMLVGSASATMNGGIADFSGLSLDTAASGYTITATSSGLTAATTNAIAVVPASPAKLVVTIPPPATLTAGAGFGLAIAAEDPYGNLTAGLTGVVTLALANDPTGATLAGPLAATATGGVANFPASLTLDAAGTGYTIRASAAGLAPVTTGPITIIAAPATQLVVLIQPPSSPTSGSAFGMVVAAEDAFGNVDPNFDGRVTVAPASGSSAILAGATTVAASQGIAPFSGLTLSGPNTPVSLQVTGARLTGATTSPITPSAANSGGGSGSGGGPGSTSPTGTGGGSVGSISLVTITGVRVVRNRRGRVTEVLVGFSGEPDPSQADSTAEYQLTEAGRRGSFAGKGARPIGLRSAVPDPAKQTVALIPRRPFALRKPVGLAVDFVRGPMFVVRGRSGPT